MSYHDSEYMFGVGDGRLSRREISQRKRIAEQHGATFGYIHGNQGHCVCGYGCALDTCDILHYWFSAPNVGEPGNSDRFRAVMAALDKAESAMSD